MNRAAAAHPFKCIALTATLLVATVGSLAAATNNWVSPTDGLWRITNNWSLALAPSNSTAIDPTLITNAGTKTVTIDSATAAVNLSVQNLFVSAPLGATNTLALVNVSASALTTLKPFTVGLRGTLLITNSAVNALDAFNVSNGVVVLDSGSITCAVSCDLQSGSLLVNTGIVNVSTLTAGIRMGRYSGANAAFTLNGGTVDTPRCILGNVSGSTATLNIAGGNLICSSTADPFTVGQIQNTTCNVTISSGSLIATNGYAGIADRAAAMFTQTGGDVAFGDLTIGGLGIGAYNLSGGTFTITPFNSANLFIIGNLENATFNQSGGTAVIREEIHIADTAGVTASLNLTGGQFIATNNRVAIGRYGMGTMMVSNAVAVLTNVSVGRHLGADGTLIVENGGSVSLIADLSIGRLVGSTGHMFVNGGLVALTSGDLWVGRGGAGDLTINGGNVQAKILHVGNSDDGINAPTGTLTINGGDTHLATGFFIGTTGLSTGAVTMVSGTLTSTNAAGTNMVNISNGSLTLNGGTFTTDAILMTNLAGLFTFNNGLLRAKSMTISNGLSFTVGDGVNPATLELQGGTYTFADGLVISPNATVTGCGTILGAVTNNGTYVNPCAAPPRVTITALALTNSAASISFVSVNGFNYTLEYKNVLSDATWTPILPAQPGTGSTVTLSDAAATNMTRYYRVGAQ